MSQASEGGPAAAREKAGKFSDLGPRVASALALVGLALAALYAGDWMFILFWLVAASGVLWEWQHLADGDRRPPIMLGGAALAAAALLIARGTFGLAFAELFLFAGFAAFAVERERRMWAAGGVVYAGLLLVSVSLLRSSPELGLAAVAWLFAVVWGTDVMAYFGGRIVGGPKLWPAVSPGKTWSGTLIGMFSGAALGLLVAGVFGVGARPLPLFVIGLLAGAVAQAGDLFESAAKRRFGVKDSGQLIPGHGGLMDRLDGFIFAAVFAALAGALRGEASAAAGLFTW